jgi:hypothetical protein
MSSVSPATKERLRKEEEQRAATMAAASGSTPQRRAHSRSRGRSRARKSDGNEIIVHDQAVQERAGPVGSIVWPMLTPTNYMEWALVMQINLEASLLWEAVDGFPMSVPNDKAALGAILRSVPPEMVGTLAMKKTAKEAWETVKTMCLGVDRVKKATAQRFRKEFGQIQFQSGETLEAFGIRINTLANNLRVLGDVVEEVTVVEKFLQVVPSKYSQIAISIETMLDTSLLTVEELIGRLRPAGDRLNQGQIGNDGQLLLMEEQWDAHKKEQSQTSGGSGGDGKHRQAKKKDKHQGTSGGGRGTPAGERDMSTVKCYNCNKNGHFSRDCTQPRKERKGKANLARDASDEAEQSLLLATTSALTVTTDKHVEHVLLNEEKSQARAVKNGDRCNTSWYLDTGVSNHMSGRREIFSELDIGTTGAVKLGDGTEVQIEGKGTIVFECRNGEHLTLKQVYYIPRLRSNILSLGQMCWNSSTNQSHEAILTHAKTTFIAKRAYRTL